MRFFTKAFLCSIVLAICVVRAEMQKPDGNAARDVAATQAQASAFANEKIDAYCKSNSVECFAAGAALGRLATMR